MADNLRENPPQRDIAGDAAQEKANQAPEEISNQARGHKANLSNPSKSTSYHPSTIMGDVLLTEGERHERGVQAKLGAEAEGARRRWCILQQGSEIIAELAVSSVYLVYDLSHS
jgi:hypothetical protein